MGDWMVEAAVSRAYDEACELAEEEFERAREEDRFERWDLENDLLDFVNTCRGARTIRKLLSYVDRDERTQNDETSCQRTNESHI